MSNKRKTNLVHYITIHENQKEYGELPNRVVYSNEKWRLERYVEELLKYKNFGSSLEFDLINQRLITDNFYDKILSSPGKILSIVL